MENARRLSGAVFLSLLTMTVTTPPTMADTSHTIAGAGTRLCSAFLREYEQDPKTIAFVYLSWAQGYLSAVNLQQAQSKQVAVDILPVDFDLPKQAAFLLAYCESSPEKHFDQAVIEMYHEFRSRDSASLGSQPGH